MIADFLNCKDNPQLLIRVTLAVIFIPLLALCATINLYQYHQIQLKLSQQSIDNAATNIQYELGEKQRLSVLFINNNKSLLASILADNENIHLLSELLVKTRDYFPDNFAVSIADNSGEILLDDFDGHIGDICRIDLKKQLQSKQPSIRVHPNPTAYHYDVITNWYHNMQRYQLFASFKLNRIAQILQSQEIHGQKLSLVIKKNDYLIEVTSSGDRSIFVEEEKMKLSKSQISNIMAEKNIQNSHWTLVAVKDSRLFIDKLIKDIIFYTIIYILYVMILVYSTRNIPQSNVQ